MPSKDLQAFVLMAVVELMAGAVEVDSEAAVLMKTAAAALCSWPVSVQWNQ